MSDSSIGVAFTGAGMAGQAHINRYRGAMAVFWPGLRGDQLGGDRGGTGYRRGQRAGTPEGRPKACGRR